MFKVNNKYTRTTPIVFIVYFEHISHLVLVFSIVNFEQVNAGWAVTLHQQDLCRYNNPNESTLDVFCRNMKFKMSRNQNNTTTNSRHSCNSEQQTASNLHQTCRSRQQKNVNTKHLPIYYKRIHVQRNQGH